MKYGEDGAQLAVYCATADEVAETSGKYFKYAFNKNFFFAVHSCQMEIQAGKNPLKKISDLKNIHPGILYDYMIIQ